MVKVINAMLLLLLCFPTYSQTQQSADSFKVSFALNSCVVDPHFEDNGEGLARIADLLRRAESDRNISIHKVSINSFASPDGGRTYNEQLTAERSRAIYDYLTGELSVSDSLIEVRNSGIDWEGLSRLVERSDMEHRREVLDIIENTPEESWRRVRSNDRWLTLVDSRVKRLADLRLGDPYRYMCAEIFPSLRVGSVVTLYFKTTLSPMVAESVEIESSACPLELSPISLGAPAPVSAFKSTKNRKPLNFALKTNLLYDLLLLPSVEVEVPIGNRWSVAGEWVCPWWVADDGTQSSARCRLQLLNANVEGKYWFGARENRDVMTGWHCGLYAGAGLYDVEYKASGYQGEFFIAAGLSGGYAHTINKSGSLRMEYSASVGYVKTEYRHYEAEWGDDDVWHPVRSNNGTYTWFGPTRLRVSLVWMVGRNAKRGGGR